MEYSFILTANDPSKGFFFVLQQYCVYLGTRSFVHRNRFYNLVNSFTNFLLTSAGQRLNDINGREVNSKDILYHSNQRFSAEKILWMAFKVWKEGAGRQDNQDSVTDVL